MVNKYDTEEVVGFPSFTVDDLRTVLSALSASEARLRVAVEALRRMVEEADNAAWAVNTSIMDDAIANARQALATIEGEKQDD
jgi:hypothetical protein